MAYFFVENRKRSYTGSNQDLERGIPFQESQAQNGRGESQDSRQEIGLEDANTVQHHERTPSTSHVVEDSRVSHHESRDTSPNSDDPAISGVAGPSSIPSQEDSNSRISLKHADTDNRKDSHSAQSPEQQGSNHGDTITATPAIIDHASVHATRAVPQTEMGTPEWHAPIDIGDSERIYDSHEPDKSFHWRKMWVKVYGRRSLLLISLFGGMVSLFVTSLCFQIDDRNPARLPVIAFMIMVFTFFYSFGCGAIPFLYCKTLTSKWIPIVADIGQVPRSFPTKAEVCRQMFTFTLFE